MPNSINFFESLAPVYDTPAPNDDLCQCNSPECRQVREGCDECSETGHHSGDCHNSYCGNCNEYGHSAHRCSRRYCDHCDDFYDTARHSRCPNCVVDDGCPVCSEQHSAPRRWCKGAADDLDCMDEILAIMDVHAKSPEWAAPDPARPAPAPTYAALRREIADLGYTWRRQTAAPRDWFGREVVEYQVYVTASGQARVWLPEAHATVSLAEPGYERLLASTWPRVERYAAFAPYESLAWNQVFLAESPAYGAIAVGDCWGTAGRTEPTDEESIEVAWRVLADDPMNWSITIDGGRYIPYRSHHGLLGFASVRAYQRDHVRGLRNAMRRLTEQAAVLVPVT